MPLALHASYRAAVAAERMLFVEAVCALTEREPGATSAFCNLFTRRNRTASIRYIRGGNDGTRFPYTLPAAQNDTHTQNLARFADLSPLLCTFCQLPIPLNVTSSSHECLEVQVRRLAVLRSVQSELLLLVIGAHARAAQHALEATHH